MMNMFQLQERIKDFSKDQLVREMQQPSGTVPPFLVLSELQRRTRMEKAFQAEQAQGQQPTVAQDAINAAGVPQGGIADMARAMAPQTDMTGNTGAAPVQQMRTGGEVKRMQPGGEIEGPNTALLRAIMEAQNTVASARARNRAMQASLNRANQTAGLAGISADLGAFRPTPAPREEVRPRGYTPTMTLPSLTSLDPLSTAEPSSIAVTGDSSAAPRLVTREGQQFAEMPDGSLIPLDELGVSPAELAGADTADLAARPGFAGRDLVSERMGEGFDTVGGLGAPILSSADRTRIGADTPLAAPRVAPTMAPQGRDTDFPTADVMRPPSVDYLRLMGALESPENTVPSIPSEEELAAIAGVPSAVLAPVQGPNLPPPPVDPSELGGLPDFMVEQRGTVPEPQRGQGIMPSDIGRAVGEAVGFGPAMDVARATRTTSAPLPMDTGTALAVPEEADGGIEALLPPPAPTTPPQTSGEAGGAGRGFDIDRMLEQDKWLALAQFGLGLMASQAPTLGGAIGEAGTAALGQLGKARQAAVERDLAERTLAARTASAGRARGPSFSNLLSYANSRITAANAALEALAMENITDKESAMDAGRGDAYDQAVRDLQEGNELLRSLGPAMAGGLGEVDYNLTQQQ